jgi:F0F1-type ATP synthase assembly protein I
MESVADPQIQPNQLSAWGWFIIISGILGGLTYLLVSAVDVAKVSREWEKYRCSPAVMPFAKMYGHNPSENFNYCLQGLFNGKMGAVLGPFQNILSVIIKTTLQFLKNLNSLRMMLATLMGGISKIVQEFTSRFKLIFMQTRKMAQRIQFLMGRVFAVMYSVIYMGSSGITAGLNFGDTIIFRFIDTFCFAPETKIEIRGRGTIPISEVVLGDICEKTGSKVTSVYRFMADGQPMVFLNGIEVSTNHYIWHEEKWIESGNHPDAHPAGSWLGGSKRPLICLDTDDHKIPLGDYIFSDWDETSSSDKETMILAEERLNGGFLLEAPRDWLYQPAVDPDMKLEMVNSTFKAAKDIQEGDILKTGKVVGKGKRHVYEWVLLPTGEKVTPSTLVWNNTHWVRAGHLYVQSIQRSEIPVEMITFVIMKTACISTSNGVTIRDMCEVHSPDMETPTSNALNPIKVY